MTVEAERAIGGSVTDSNTEIAVEDPTAPSADSPAVASTRTVETIVYVMDTSASSRGAIDEKASLGHDTFSSTQAIEDLDHLSV